MQILRMIIVGMVLGVVMAHPCLAANDPNGGDAAPIEAVKTNGDLKIRLNFQDAPLQTVLEYLSETAGLAVVSDEPIVNGRITVISRQPIALVGAVSLINSVLKEKGLTTVLIGKTLKVVTLANAKTENLPVLTGRDPNAIVPGDDVVTYVIPVAHVTASALKGNLTALLPSYAILEANEDGNTLIITDTTANIQRLMRIVVALDTHMAGIAEIRVFRLVNTSATSVSNLINSIFQQQAQGTNRNRNQRGGIGNPIEMMMQMRGGPGGRGGDNNSTSTSGGSVNVQVVAAADEQTNSVVVRGPVEALDLVEQIVDSLDDKSAKVADVRVFQLRYADAVNTADVINQLFNQSQSSNARGRTGRGGAAEMQGPMVFRGPFGGAEGQQAEGSSSLVQVTAAADSRTNTVVVTGPQAVLDVVAGVIEKLDTPLSNVADVKVFRLQYADASNTAQLVNEVFGQSRTTSSTTRSTRGGTQQNQQIMFRGGQMGGFGGMGGQQGQTSSTTDVAIVASADTRTNSVVVSGPAETLVVIAQIVKELDENPAAERRIFVYWLKNADATNLMTILNNLFQEMQALNQQVTGSRASTTGGQRNVGGAAGGAPGGGGATGGTTTTSSSGDSLSEETYFQADPNTNSLLIMTSTKNYERIKPTIDELDKPVGQVLIKILFAELTHSDSVDLGTEFSMLNLRSGGGFTQTTQVFPRPLDLTTPGIGGVPGTQGPTGLSVRVLEQDLDITLHALQQTGRLNVLSRPYVMTRNNQTATIRVVEEVPIPESETTQGSIGSSTTFTYRTDIGIVLEVRPSVNPDGLVNMVVTPQITTRTGETVQISANLNPVVFATRSANTRVAVHDGQTVVIGGLIEDQSSDVVHKVPLLGDIPIAGALFRRTVRTKGKTELLIFLTPHVAEDPHALTPISDRERLRSNLNTDSDTSEMFKWHMDGMGGGKED